MKTQRFQTLFGLILTALIVGVFAPTSSLAATCPDYSGKVVKVKNVYWLVKDNQRYEFVDSVAMQTWDKTAVTAKLDCVKDFPVVGVINYRPGSRLIKKAGEATVYAVGKNMTLHAVDTAAVKQWYGLNWRALVRTVPAAKFQEFTIGAPLTVDSLHDGVLVKQVGKSQVYYVTEGKLAKVEGKLRPALSGKVLVLSAKNFARLTISGNTVKAGDIAGDPINAMVPVTEGTVPVSNTAPTTNNNTDTSVKADSKSVDGQTFTGANYTGPFPAPEGMVLEGFIGNNSFKQPTGNGAYRFVLKTESPRSINCLDSTRTVWKSKGKNYDAGFKSGINYGIKDGDNIFVRFDDTPRGAGAVGNQYFDQGFRVGYKHGYEVGDDFGVYYNCQKSAFDITKYDEDGWYKATGLTRTPNVKAIFSPGGAPDAARLSDGYAFTYLVNQDGMRLEEQELNVGKQAVNLSRIEFAEAKPEGAEVAMTMPEVAKMSYDAAVKYTATKYNRICTSTEPTIETNTYGANEVTSLSFLQICAPDSKTITWKLQAYSFIKGKTSGNVLTVTFIDPFDLKKAGANELDTTKLPSNDFIAQFPSKIQFN